LGDARVGSNFCSAHAVWGHPDVMPLSTRTIAKKKKMCLTSCMYGLAGGRRNTWLSRGEKLDSRLLWAIDEGGISRCSTVFLQGSPSVIDLDRSAQGSIGLRLRGGWASRRGPAHRCITFVEHGMFSEMDVSVQSVGYLSDQRSELSCVSEAFLQTHLMLP
jgi:hypothetical protein